MKKFLIVGFAATALFGAPAMAAEMPLKAAPLLFDWTGWYVGGNGGYSWGSGRTTVTSGGTTATPFDASIRHRGWEGSGEGGYCVQMTERVVCFEVRYDGPREKGRISTPVGVTDTLETQPKPPSTILIGPHFGVLTDMNHMLWFVSGGLAVGESGASTTIDGNVLNTSDKWKAGWFLGAGVERMIDQHWSWKLEYDYVRIGGGGVSATYPAGTFAVLGRGSLFLDPVTVNSNKDAYDNKISFGINYHFGSH
jgi:outer membrane immunogenic protein